MLEQLQGLLSLQKGQKAEASQYLLFGAFGTVGFAWVQRVEENGFPGLLAQ